MVVHEDGRRTGKLLRTWDGVFDRPAPSAYGATTQDVFEELEAKLEALELESRGSVARYLWEEDFRTQKVRVDIHPLSSVKKRAVIGKKEIPLHITYAYCPLKGGGYRVMMPRFGGWFIVEDLSVAPDVLRHFVSTLLLGESARWVYDFREVDEEYVTEWSPAILQRQRDEVAPRREVDPNAELSRVGDELVARAARGKLAPVVGDSAVFASLERTTLAPRPPSLLLVGPPGAGKSALVRRLAFHHLAAKKDAETKPPRIYSTSKDRIIAGMTYLGMWQERCIRLARELDEGGDYLHVAALGGLLEPQHDGATIADFFEAGMNDGSIRLIAECTQEELERARRARPTFVAELTIVRVPEPSPVETTTLALAYARKKSLDVHPSAMKRLVRHLSALERGVAFPGKALRFVDWLALENKGAEGKTLYPRDASAAYSRYSGVPLTLLSDDVAAGPEALAALLSARVIGQDAACGACGRLLARFKASLGDPERPSGVLLFVGPTGVGKTELAKQLARTTFGGEERMIRLDMSEYMLPGSATRLTTSRPGTASLAARVREQPLSLVLLDEIEKAHAEVFDLLLGILGEGRLTDDSGRFVDFRTTMIVMTSNLGVSDRPPAGFGDATNEASTYLRKVRAHFRPELYNRIDYVLPFRALAPADVERIVDLELASALNRTGFTRRSVHVRASPAARARLAERGYHPTRGARPLRRLIEEAVMTPIATRLAADPTFRDREVPVIADEEEEPDAAFFVRV
ncbi:MAG: ATP-dependent Clp protease ATP-binding subunit [Labilithrix sp.]|nr:ATP-dependent Clp protease ATP-binding subunit [Labilithrix sp.]MCW5816591.1 ATP-dependent Clp protease ATP-binding subunit [Labilithrix sp.]